MKSAEAVDVRIRALREADVARTASMLARAFEEDAAYCYLFPDARQRPGGLADFFARNLRTHLPYRCTHVAVDAQGELLATITLRPAGGLRISVLTMLRRGLLPFAMTHGRAAVARLMWLKQAYDALEVDAARDTSHSYVHMMAVAPVQQGRGVGGRLLQSVLAQETSQTVLTTNLPRNLIFYRRQGFEVTAERTLQPPNGAPYLVWSMRRNAGAHDASSKPR